jgi:hypothetical protein
VQRFWLAFTMLAVAGAALIRLSGCNYEQGHQWLPGPQATETWAVASGRCKMLALQAEPRGTGGLLGGAGEASRRQTVYNACLESAGFEPQD